MKRSEFLTLLATPFLAFLPKTAKIEPNELMSVLISTEKGSQVLNIEGTQLGEITVFDHALSQAEIDEVLRVNQEMKRSQIAFSNAKFIPRGEKIMFPLEYKT